MKYSILLVDDEPKMLRIQQEMLSPLGYSMVTAGDGQAAMERLAQQSFDAIITDVKMPRVDGMSLLTYARHRQPETPVILITAYAQIQQAVEAIKQGSFDYLVKPVTASTLQRVVGNAIKKRQLALIQQSEQTPRATCSVDELIGASGPMQWIRQMVLKAARSDVPVLIEGESGTGKELVALAVHHHSARRQGPHVKVNCAAIPESLFESELFGFKKGAFTGASENKPGKIELAHGGTLFLDEISALPLLLQPKLLRVLQGGEFYRLGEGVSRQVDVRVIAASNHCLPALLAKGQFREDLFYRINVFPINIPPLRERKSDIPLLIRKFLEKFGTLGRSEPLGEVSPDAMKSLLSHAWPGNVRELQNAIQYAAAIQEGPVLQRENLPAAVLQPFFSAPSTRTPKPLREHERELILATLQREGGNKTRAAQSLGISRQVLYEKIRRFALLNPIA